jgi:co-chaperonin GroES (HSP10)
MTANVNIRPVMGRIMVLIPPPVERINGLLLRGRIDRSVLRIGIVKALPAGYDGELNAGDRVLVPPFPDREVVVNKERLVFLDADEIPAVLEV